MTSIPWPEDLCSGTATWWLGYMAADSDVDDDRNPQLKAGAGIRVNFTPDVSNAVLYRGEEGNKTIMPLVSTGVIDDDGYLCTMNEDGSAGTLGVVLPSSECETLTPQDWTWTVTVTENRIRINRFSISLSPGEEIDLADYVPVDSSGGTHIVTEVETAERAEKAAGEAETFRDEARTARQAAQTARTGAETAETNARTHATDAASSASSAADILAATEALGITVDTSVGTRVFVGDTMIHGDTGWRDLANVLPDGIQVVNGTARIRRINGLVSLLLSSVEVSTTSSDVIFPLPSGFVASRYTVFESVPYWNSESEVTGRVGPSGIQFQNLQEGSRMNVTISWVPDANWPSILPGTPL